MYNWLRSLVGWVTPSWLQQLLTGYDYVTLGIITVLSYIWKFPFLSSSTWYFGLMQLPLWLLWYAYLTQPKHMDSLLNTITNTLKSVADVVWGWFWPPKPPFWGIIFLVICSFTQMWFIPAFALAFKSWKIGGDKKWTIGRLVLTFGLCNFAASEKIMSTTTGKLWKGVTDDWYNKIPVGWLISYGLVILLLVIWLLFQRSHDEKQHAKDVFRKRGSFLGFFYLMIEDFLPNPVDWECPECHHKNPIDKDGKSADFCSSCGARNPDRWYCPNCKERNKPADTACKKCGTRKPSTDPIPPGGTVTCPGCNSAQPPGAFCGQCGHALNQAGTTATSGGTSGGTTPPPTATPGGNPPPPADEPPENPFDIP